MNNIENFAEVGTYDTMNGTQFHDANTNSNGSISENEQAAFLEQEQVGGDPMAEAQSGYEVGQAHALRNIEDGSLNPEYVRSNIEGGDPYVGGYVRGFDETIQADQAVKMAAPPLGPDDPMGPALPRPGGPMGQATDSIQTGGDGFRLGVDAEMVGGQAVVEGYDSEQAVCSDNQVGGGSPFNFITDPDSGDSLSIFSAAGKALLKRYVKAYKQIQSGGAALLEGVEPNAQGALYDGIQNAGAEALQGACDVTYDAVGPEWTHTQVGGGGKKSSYPKQ